MTRDAITQSNALATVPPASQALLREVFKGKDDESLQVCALALSQDKMWREAAASPKGGALAVRVALQLVRDFDLDPLARPRQLWLMAPEGQYEPRLSAHGLTRIASGVQDARGRPMLRGIDFEYLGEQERNGEPYVLTKAKIFWGTSDAFIAGIGRKPRFMTVGVYEGSGQARRKVGERKVFDPNAEGKSESMAIRRALEMASPREIPWARLAPVLDHEDVIDVDGEAEELPALTEGGVPAETPLITDPQMRALHAIAKDLGMDHEQLRARIGVESLKTLSRDDAGEWITSLQQELEERPA